MDQHNWHWKKNKETGEDQQSLQEQKMISHEVNEPKHSTSILSRVNSFLTKSRQGTITIIYILFCWTFNLHLVSKWLPFPVLPFILQQKNQTYSYVKLVDLFVVSNLSDIELSPYPGSLRFVVKSVLLSLGVWTVRISCMTLVLACRAEMKKQ